MKIHADMPDDADFRFEPLRSMKGLSFIKKNQ